MIELHCGFGQLPAERIEQVGAMYGKLSPVSPFCFVGNFLSRSFLVLDRLGISLPKRMRTLANTSGHLGSEPAKTAFGSRRICH